MKKSFCILVFLMLAVSNNVFAHGLATSKNQTEGNYLVEFEYDSVGNPTAGDFQVYNFSILDSNTKKFLDFDYVFFRIDRKQEGVVANGKLSMTEAEGKKTARVGVTIAEPGEYAVEAAFYDKNNSKLVSATFDFTVDPPYKPADDRQEKFSNFNKNWLWALFALLLFTGIYFVKIRKKS